MSKRPILVLQMQRMGDLILSFPLFLWLERVYPGHPIWVIGEEKFYKPLMQLSPMVTYFPWAGLSFLKKEKFELVVNLSIREEGAILAGELESQACIGPIKNSEGSTYISGDWQLYRASVVHNNKHNKFHWADLNALDVIPHSVIAATRWSAPRKLDKDDTKVGIFLGASEIAKRPTSDFYASLCSELLGRGLRPVLLGGELEKQTAIEVCNKFNGPVLDMCGKLNLNELSMVGQTLQLLITPDTGPMHLAAWTGLQVLNLSMGNVNPYETGPYQSGHYVLRSKISCAKGCWECSREKLYCHDSFNPAHVASLAKTIISSSPESLTKLNISDLEFMRSGVKNGLYDLAVINGKDLSDERSLLADFWHAFFKNQFGYDNIDEVYNTWLRFASAFPDVAEKNINYLPILGKDFSKGLATSKGLDETFWSKSPIFYHQFTGYIDLLLQNNNYSRLGWVKSLALYEKLAVIFSKT